MARFHTKSNAAPQQRAGSRKGAAHAPRGGLLRALWRVVRLTFWVGVAWLAVVEVVVFCMMLAGERLVSGFEMASGMVALLALFTWLRGAPYAIFGVGSWRRTVIGASGGGHDYSWRASQSGHEHPQPEQYSELDAHGGQDSWHHETTPALGAAFEAPAIGSSFEALGSDYSMASGDVGGTWESGGPVYDSHAGSVSEYEYVPQAPDWHNGFGSGPDFSAGSSSWEHSTGLDSYSGGMSLDSGNDWSSSSFGSMSD